MTDFTRKKLSTVPEMPEKEKDEPRTEDDKKEAEEAPPQKLSFFKLFKFSTKTDFIMIGVGCLGSCLSAASWPLLNIYFSRIVNVFARFEGEWMLTAGNGTVQEKLRTDFMHDVYMNSLALAVITCGFILGSFTMMTTFQRFALRLMRELKQRYFTSILAQEVAWHDEQNTGEFASKITSDFKKLESGINENLGLFLQNLLCFFLNLIIGIVNGWKLALITIAFTPITGIVGGVISRLSTKWTNDSSKASGEASTASEEAISAIRTVYAFNGQKKEVERYEKILKRGMLAGVKQNFASSFNMASAWGSMYASFAVGIWYGGRLILTGEYDIGQVMLVFWSIMSAGMNMGQAAPYFEALQISLASAFSIFGIIERESVIDPFRQVGAKLDSDKFVADIELRGVHFRYPSRPTAEVLKGIDLRVNNGEIVALVGPSGCGKSSIIQIIQRFYDPEKGAVLVGGHDIRELNVGWLRQQMGVVGQEPVLFDDTIEENIRLGVPYEQMAAVDVKDIHQAAVEANAAEFIERLPKKYHTNVGERGTQLSGGQKQRVAIGRALLARPKILLLDEATSAIDMRSEEIVQAALDRAVRGRTTIIVAHRLSTIRNAHRIVYIDAGQVVEQGTHDQLMEAKGAYYKLVTGQTVDTGSDDHSAESDENDHQQDGGIAARKESVKEAQRRRVSTKESFGFNEVEEGEEKDPKKKVKPPPFPYGRMLKLIWKDKLCLIIGLVAALIYGTLTPAYAWIFGRYVDVIIAKTSYDETMKEVVLCAVYYIILAVTAFTVTVLQISLFGYISEHLCLRLRIAAYRAIMSSEIAFFDLQENSPGSLCSRLSDDAANIQEATGTRISMYLQAFATLLVSIGISFYYNWKMALVSIGLIPFIVASSAISGDIFMQQAVKNSKASAMASKLAIEVMNAIRTVVSLNKEKYFTNKFLGDLLENFEKLSRKVYLKSLVISVALGIPFFVYMVAILFGGYLISQRVMSSGEFFTIIESVLFGSMVIGQAAVMSGNISKAKNAASNIFKLIDRPTQGDGLAMGTVVVVNDQKEARCKGEISFENVSFNYPNRPKAKVLTGLSFTAKVGETVALVGESGSGKSTTVQLLEQFYQPNGGRIYLDGRPIESYPRDWLRSQMSLVQQEPILFSYSIRENIAYGDLSREVSDAEIIAAAKMANIHEFIEQLPEGYSTPVGSKGVVSLSGGQRQRVAIARGLIRNPQVVLLDEATSALDNESEKLVQQALDKAAKDRTCIVIAHRLKTIVDAHKIIVFSRGQKIEEGTHRELIDRKGFYWKLYNSAMSNMVA